MSEDRTPARRRGHRLIALTSLVATLTALNAGAAAAQLAPGPGSELLPDLITRPHSELYVQGNMLRLSNTIANRGTGPLEIYPEPTAGDDCDGDGDPANDRRAFQRTFRDSGNSFSLGYFLRGQDNWSSARPIGCMIYHPAHSHWHFQDFSLYVLRQESTGLVAGRSVKVSFCVIDTDHLFPGYRGSPGSSYYGGDGCGPSSVEGMSIGWADTYGASLAGQSLVISGLPPASYCLISRADPVDRLHEANEANNGRATRILLDPGEQSVQVLPGACQLGT